MMKMMRYLLLLLLILNLLNNYNTYVLADDEVDYDNDSEEDNSNTYKEGGNVKIGTVNNFNELIQSTNVVMVEFFAPWCGHCQSLKPEYEAAAQQVVDNKLNDKITLVAVDVTVEEKLGEEYKIQGFPTIMIFKNGKVFKDYDGARQADDLYSALETMVLPAVRKLNTKDEVDTFLKSSSVAVLGHFTVPENEAAQKVFSDTAETLREGKGTTHIRFGELDSSLANEYKMIETPVVKLRRNMDKDEADNEISFDFFHEKGWDKEKFQNWVEANSFPILAEINAQNYRLYEQRGLPFVWLFLDPDSNDDTDKAIKDKVREVAKNNLGKTSFVYLKGEEYGEHAKELGVTKFPGVSITTADNKKFPSDDTADKIDLNNFITQFLDNKLTPFFKSEDIPENNDGPVKIVVAKSFDDIVFNSGNDVFIEFYAPWCGHCQQLAPIWDKLGTALKDTKGITIAKIDATANDVSKLVEGFPTLYFHKAKSNDKEMVPDGIYEGARTFNAFVKFLRKNSDATLPDDLGREIDHNAVLSFLDELDGASDDAKKLEALKKYNGYVPKDLRAIVTEHQAGASTADDEGDMENGDEDDGDAFDPSMFDDDLPPPEDDADMENPAESAGVKDEL